MDEMVVIRQKWIDTIKGIAIFLVVLGHALGGMTHSGYIYNGVIETKIYEGIYIFHMPFFMAISGWVFAMAYLPPKCDWGGGILICRMRQYRDQICNLLFLYFSFSILLVVFKCVFRVFVNEPIEWIHFIMIPFRYLPNTPLWYIYILAIIYLLAGILLKQRWNKDIIILISFLLCILYRIFPVKEVVTAQKIFYYFFFFMLGCMLCIRKERLIKKCMLLQCVIAFGGEGMILYLSDTLPEPVIGLMRIVVSILMINIFFVVAQRYGNNAGILSILGEKSIEIYLLHGYVTSGIRPILRILHIRNYWVSVSMATVLGIAVPIAISYILRKMKLWEMVFKPVKYIKKHNRIPERT